MPPNVYNAYIANKLALGNGANEMEVRRLRLRGALCGGGSLNHRSGYKEAGRKPGDDNRGVQRWWRLGRTLGEIECRKELN